MEIDQRNNSQIFIFNKNAVIDFDVYFLYNLMFYS